MLAVVGSLFAQGKIVFVTAPAATSGGSPLDVLGGMACCCPFFIFFLLFALLPIIGQWKAFEKAGKPGWASLVPVYNMMVMAEIGGKEATYGLLCLIPVAGVVFAIIIMLEVCKRFGKDVGFLLGLMFLPFVFWPILGFGNAQYVGSGPGARPGY